MFDPDLTDIEKEELSKNIKENSEITNALKRTNYLEKGLSFSNVYNLVERNLGKPLTKYQEETLLYRFKNKKY